MILPSFSRFIRWLTQYKKQVLVYGLIWFALYWLITAIYWATLNSRGQENGIPVDWGIARWLSAGHTLLFPLTYYWVAHVMYRTILRQRWLIAIIQGVTMYIVIAVLTYFLYTAVGSAYLNVGSGLTKFDTSLKITGPFYSLTSGSIFLPNWWLYSLLLTAVAIKVSQEIYYSENRALRLEMNLLRAQINPHFLFNTLNNIYSLVEEKDAYAAEILLKFGDIMRYTLYETHTNFISLTQEVDMLNEYIDLERIRHSASSQTDITFDVLGDPREVNVPPLLLITVVENAFKHGVQATIGQSWVRIKLEVNNQQIHFTVMNSKPPAPPSRPTRQKINVHRVGLANIQRRLDLLYQDQHQLTINDKADTYTIAITLAKHGRSDFLSAH